MGQVQPKHSGWILTATILASGLGFFMGSAVNVMLPTIQGVWDLELAVVQWVANGYALTLSAFILLSGALGDLFGVRRTFAAGILIFAGGGALCALSPTPAFLIGSRAVQGFGAAIMVPGSLAIINRLFPEEDRGRVIGLWAGISGAIAALGPFLGGVLAEVSWRLAFWFVVPVGIVAAWITLKYVPVLRDDTERPVDWAGAGCVLAGLGGLSYGLVRIPEVGVTWLTGGALMLAFFSGVAFLFVERRAAAPIVPFQMMDRGVGVANLATILLYFSFQGSFFILSFLLQQLVGYSASFTGIAFLPATFMIAIFAAPSGKITDRLGPRFQLVAGPFVVASALVIMILGARVESFLMFWLPVILLFGGGMVLLVPAVTKAALLVPDRFSGAASGVNNAAARTAGLLAITVLGAALNGGYQAVLPDLLPGGLSPDMHESILAGAGRLLSAPLPEGMSPELAAAVEEARRAAFAFAGRLALSVAAAAALAGSLLSLAAYPREKT